MSAPRAGLSCRRNGDISAATQGADSTAGIAYNAAIQRRPGRPIRI